MIQTVALPANNPSAHLAQSPSGQRLSALVFGCFAGLQAGVKTGWRTGLVTVLLTGLGIAVSHPIAQAQTSRPVAQAPRLVAQRLVAQAPRATTPQALTMDADTQEANSKTGVVTARGNVRLNFPARRIQATAAQAQYFSREGRIVLTGNVYVIQSGGNSMRGEVITYLVNEGRFVALPRQSQQVRSVYMVNDDATPTP
jgi:lipopolysaccharide export system protein LptA